MGCNCNDTSPCGRCQNGQPCNCPPSYTVTPAPSPCQCCPNGYVFQPPNAQYPNGTCISISQNIENTKTCCPAGYTYFGPTLNYPNGYCIKANDASSIIQPIGCIQITTPIPCVPCEDAITTDCVTYSGIIPIACGIPPGNIYGIIPGDTLTTIVNKMCATNTSVIEAVLSTIGLDTTLLSGFCQLTQSCPPAGSTFTIVSIIITFP